MPKMTFNMAQYSPSWLNMASNMLQEATDRPKAAPTGHGAFQRSRQETKTLQTPKENNACLPSRLFASDGPPRPQDGSKMAQENPKRGPREPQDGSKSAQDRPKSAPRGVQERV